MTELLPEDQRKELFRMLVELQDEGHTTEDSRIRVAAQFSIDVHEVLNIEREGIARQWPPLE
jgi:hypothetical protein